MSGRGGSSDNTGMLTFLPKRLSLCFNYSISITNANDNHLTVTHLRFQLCLVKKSNMMSN